MKLDLTDMLYALSFALDKVEAELVGVDTGHGKRVAYMAMLMGKQAGCEEEALRDFIGCCLLHDNALTEFISEELSGSHLSDGITVDLSELAERKKPHLLRHHSVVGEENIRLMPFRTDVRDIILYHHENADGSGAMGKKAAETNLKAQILHLADIADATLHLDLERMTNQEYDELCRWIKDRTGTLFSEEVTELFFKAVTCEKLLEMREKGLSDALHHELPKKVLDYSDGEIRNIAEFFSKIVDYKSEFTQRHSTGVAQKAEIMAKFYGFDPEKAIRFYFAGALHDIGKLAVSNDILEKPDKLTADEFTEMKNHASATYYILSQVKEIPDILEWAANHHEKLNGKGYPRGLSEKELSFEDQLMAVVDIYQALTEKRPYKDGMSHEKTVSILKEMVDRGELNGQIVDDIDTVMTRA